MERESAVRCDAHKTTRGGNVPGHRRSGTRSPAMDKTILVEPDIKQGKRLIKELDKAGFPVLAAFWLYLEESGVWRSHIASPVEAAEGRKAAYTKVNEL